MFCGSLSSGGVAGVGVLQAGPLRAEAGRDCALLPGKGA